MLDKQLKDGRNASLTVPWMLLLMQIVTAHSFL
jgi:hypothetical protein